MKKVLLVDFSSLIHVYFYGYKSQKPVIDGFSFLMNIIYQRYDEIYFCLDCKPKKRSEEQSSYKANRDNKDKADIYKHKDIIYSIIGNLKKVKFIIKQGFEADDLLAILFYKYKNDNTDVSIFSRDRDMWQLYSDGCNIITTINNYGTEYVFESNIREKFYDVSPEALLLFRTLSGDKSDNIDPIIKGMRRVYYKEFAEKWLELRSIDETLEFFKEHKQLSNLKSLKETIISNYKMMSLRHYKKIAHKFNVPNHTLKTLYKPEYIKEYNLVALNRLLILDNKDTK